MRSLVCQSSDLAVEPKIILRSPEIVSDGELGDFVSLVRAGGEVNADGLEDRVCKAEHLVFLRVENCLAGIGALKNPLATYRKKIAHLSETGLPVSSYPFELGWVFVLPSFRERKLGKRIVEAIVDSAKGAGIFATSRAENVRMHSALGASGFLEAGEAFKSPKGDYKLQLFLRHGAT